MKKVLKFLQLSFLPTSVDLGLLVLRVWIGFSMLILHGWPKVSGYSAMLEKWQDPLGIGKQASLIGAIFGELVCSGLIVLGLATRFAALVAAFTMGVAFFIAHKGVLKGPGSGEMAFLYMAVFVTLILTGPGKLSLDAKLGGAK